MLHKGERTIRGSPAGGSWEVPPRRKLHAFRDRSVALRPVPIRMEITWTGPPVEIVFPTKFLA